MSNHVATIEALGDVVDKIAEATESMTADEAVRVMNALGGLARRIRGAQGLCETQAIKVLEGQPIEVDGVRYLIKSEGKWRPDPLRVKNRVISVSVCDPSTGEMREPRLAAEAAVDLMFGLYVSPATMPKTGGLAAIGYGKNDVAEFEATGTKLEPERPA